MFFPNNVFGLSSVLHPLIFREIFSKKIYQPYYQNHIVPAQYWHDPLAPKAYISKSKFLADINMEGPKPNKTYAINLKKLEKLVLVMYENVSRCTKV